MAEEETIFDASIKKKKKKKTGFNLDALDGPASEPQENGAVAMEVEEPLVQEEKKKKSKNKVSFEDTPIEDLAKDDFSDLDLMGKKKKKTKKTKFALDDLKEALPEGENDENAAPNMEDLEMDFSKMKKKPKKPSKVVGIEDLLIDEGGRDEADAARDGDRSDGWLDSDRDYTYDELFQRAFSLLREKNPDMAAGEKKRFVMKPPQVLRIGSKKTAFANFSEICRLLHRMPKHLLQFLLAELGTSGSIDGNNQLIIKGRFQQKQIENVLKRYIKEYVTCHTCRSPNTILQKDARLYFLQCEQCNSRCSVAPIKSGFQAVANKQQRQAIRASKN